MTNDTITQTQEDLCGFVKSLAVDAMRYATIYSKGDIAEANRWFDSLPTVYAQPPSDEDNWEQHCTSLISQNEIELETSSDEYWESLIASGPPSWLSEDHEVYHRAVSYRMAA